MSSISTKFGLAALVAFGGMGVASQANAAQIDVVIGGPRVVVRQPVVVVRPRPVVIRRAPVVVVQQPYYGACRPQQALNKAFNAGLNRASISKIGPNRVVVTGKLRGMWAKMTFANVRGCPRL